MSEPLIHPDITKAHTLPSRFYTDEKSFQHLMNDMRNSWYFAAHSSQFVEHDVIPLIDIEEMLGDALILTNSDKIRCLSNVCTHRGMLVATGPRKCSTLQCKYHGRTFGMDGCLKNMPEFQDVEGFPSASDDLPGFPITEWKGLQLVGGDRYLKEAIAELQSRLGWLDVASFKHDKSRFRSYEIGANWALYVDNYLEGFHIPFVHGDLHGVLDDDEYRTELFEGGVLQIGIARKGEPHFAPPENSQECGERVAAYYYWFYPGLMLNFYPWGLSINQVIPLSVDRTRIVYHGYVGNPEMLGKGAGGDLDKVEMEDQEIVEATQRGVSSKSYDRGRYSPKMERGVHHFHRMMTHNE
ncbi:MAG: choline monooxygenase [Euryarchaeota archaeon]|nr:choline monooxygenase [Euryarchaeota archaeon]